MKGLKKPKPLSAIGTALAAAMGGAKQGMSTPERPAARTEEPDYERDLERHHANEMDRMLVENILSGKAAASNLSHTYTAAELRRKGRGAEVPPPAQILKAPPSSSDLKDERYEDEIEE